jgi:hypothetical protein
MSKGAAKSARLDAAALRKRAGSKGDVVVEVKPGEAITGLAVGWALERFVAGEKKEGKKRAESGKRKAASEKKKVTSSRREVSGKKKEKAKPAKKKKK